MSEVSDQQIMATPEQIPQSGNVAVTERRDNIARVVENVAPMQKSNPELATEVAGQQVAKSAEALANGDPTTAAVHEEMAGIIAARNTINTEVNTMAHPPTPGIVAEHDQILAGSVAAELAAKPPVVAPETPVVTAAPQQPSFMNTLRTTVTGFIDSLRGNGK